MGEDNTISMTVSEEPAESAVGNKLLGVDVGTSIYSLGNGTLYVLGNKNDHFGFHKFTGFEMPARRAYLSLDVDPARELNIVFDNDATALTLVNSEERTVNSDVYDLQGRKVNNPAKGLYIVNGRKVVVK